MKQTVFVCGPFLLLIGILLIGCEDPTALMSSDTYTVTYNSNNADSGVPPTDGSRYETGATVHVKGNTGTPPLEKADFSFDGWTMSIDGSGTIYNSGDTFTMGSSNAVMYARWVTIPDTYTLTYDGNGATSGNSPTEDLSHESGAIVTVQGNSGDPPLERTGFSFSGWNTASDGSGTFYEQGDSLTMGASHVVLYAVWTTEYVNLEIGLVDNSGPVAIGTGDDGSTVEVGTGNEGGTVDIGTGDDGSTVEVGAGDDGGTVDIGTGDDGGTVDVGAGDEV
jgi:hypothetical protein